jgi:hypothetical protein
MVRDLLKACYEVTLYIHRNREVLDGLPALGAGQTQAIPELFGASVT